MMWVWRLALQMKPTVIFLMYQYCHNDILQLTLLVVICMHVATEKETPEVFLEVENAAQDGEQTAEVQEDEGDWEEVGPRNKSMVTRMVRGFKGTVIQLIPV